MVTNEIGVKDDKCHDTYACICIRISALLASLLASFADDDGATNPEARGSFERSVIWVIDNACLRSFTSFMRVTAFSRTSRVVLQTSTSDSLIVVLATSSSASAFSWTSRRSTAFKKVSRHSTSSSHYTSGI